MKRREKFRDVVKQAKGKYIVRKIEKGRTRITGSTQNSTKDIIIQLEHYSNNRRFTNESN